MNLKPANFATSVKIFFVIKLDLRTNRRDVFANFNKNSKYIASFSSFNQGW